MHTRVAGDTVSIQELRRTHFGVTSHTDNSREFELALHWYVLDKGIDPFFLEPSIPRLSGKVERFHRIDSEELYWHLEMQITDDAPLITEQAKKEQLIQLLSSHGPFDAKTSYERPDRKWKF